MSVCWSGLRANGMSLGPSLIPDRPSACLDHRDSSQKSGRCGLALDAHFGKYQEKYFENIKEVIRTNLCIVRTNLPDSLA